MFDSLFLTLVLNALNSITTFERVEYPTFQDSNGASEAVLLPAVAAHIDTQSGCVVYTDPVEGSVLRVELPSPLSPDYDYCYAHLTGAQFNG